MVGFEYYDRSALPASDRLQATSDLVPFGGTNFDVALRRPRHDRGRSADLGHT